jgi:hypothetical protein
MAPPDAQASASYGCSAFLSHWSRWHPGSDRLGTIDLPCRRASGVVIQCRAIVPNGSARRASGGVLRLFGLFVLLSAVASRFRSIGDNRSTMPTHSGGVIQCRAIVPNGSARRASGGVLRLFGFFILLSAVALGSDRLGTIDLPCRRTAALSYSVEPLSPMAPPDAQASVSYGCSAFLSYCLRWLPGSDRLGTIDLPCRRTAAVSYSVEPLSPMAPPDAQAAASYGCSAFLSYCLRWL